MTREEAIEFGKMWLELQEECKNSNTYEFFKMAIEALQQEPTYTSEVAQKAYEDGKKDGYMQRKIETIAENLTSSKLKKAIENLPSIKPQEPRKGNWIIDGHHRRCPECDEYFCIKDAEGNEIASSFCPNCGADMREVLKDEIN